MPTLHYVAPSRLEAAFLSGDEDRIVEELRKVSSLRTRRRSRASIITRILEKAESPRVRNAAALALADMRMTSAKEKLINVLKKPETRGCRGTILYALEELGVNLPLSLLVDLILNDSYEASQEALDFIASGKIDYDESRDEIKRRLMALRKRLTKEKSHAVDEALKYLSLNQ
jgi:HEAT repeat protein